MRKLSVCRRKLSVCRRTRHHERATAESRSMAVAVKAVAVRAVTQKPD